MSFSSPLLNLENAKVYPGNITNSNSELLNSDNIPDASKKIKPIARNLFDEFDENSVKSKYNNLPPPTPCKRQIRRPASNSPLSLRHDNNPLLKSIWDDLPAETNVSLNKRPGDLLVQCSQPTKKAKNLNQNCSNTNQSLYKVIYESIKNSKMTIKNLPIKTTYFAAGTFVEVYSINASKPLFKGIKNENILLKVFNRNHMNFPDKTHKYMENSLANYKQALNLNIPCAEIYNADTALQDGYYLVERIQDEIKLSDEIDIDNLNPHLHANYQSFIEKVRYFFEISYNNKFLIDLSISNIRQNSEGKFILTDFVEKPFSMELREKYGIFAIQFLKSWCKAVQVHLKEQDGRAVASRLLTDLTRDLNYDDKWIEAALDTYFRAD